MRERERERAMNTGDGNIREKEIDKNKMFCAIRLDNFTVQRS